MEKRIIVSGGGGLRVFSCSDGLLLRRVPLAGAGALCCGGGAVYCACGQSGVICRLDLEMLVPQKVFCAGPGICALAYRVGRLYALCGEADGIMMLDAVSGAPLVFSRAGLAPMQMAMDETGGALVVAGGEGSCIARFCPDTLEQISLDRMPGPVYGAAVCGGMRSALCLSESLDTLLVTVNEAGKRCTLRFPGIPGTLACHQGGKMILAAVQGGIYAVSSCGRQAAGFCPIPGCLCGGGSRILCVDDRTFLLVDAASESLWSVSRGRSRLICTDAVDAALLDT